VRLARPATRAAAATAGAEMDTDRKESVDGFREAMSHLATGVVMVTACVEGRPWGMTVSACCPVCTDPATVLVSLAQHTVLARAISRTERFGVSILGQRAIDIARYGATTGEPKFLDDVCDSAAADDGVGVVDGALCHVDCQLADAVPYGDHVLNLGTVRAIRLLADDAPLVYYGRDYRHLGIVS